MYSVVLVWGPKSAHFLLPAMPWGPFTPLYTDSTRERDPSGRGRHPLQPNEAAHVVHQVHHANLHAGTRNADGAHELAAHRVFLIPKHALDANAHSRTRGVGRLLALRQRMVTGTATMDRLL
jgi:hypothetical protein